MRDAKEREADNLVAEIEHALHKAGKNSLDLPPSLFKFDYEGLHAESFFGEEVLIVNGDLNVRGTLTQLAGTIKYTIDYYELFKIGNHNLNNLATYVDALLKGTLVKV